MKLEKLLERELETRIQKGEVFCDDCQIRKAILISGDKCLCQNCYDRSIDKTKNLFLAILSAFMIVGLSEQILDCAKNKNFIWLVVCAVAALAIVIFTVVNLIHSKENTTSTEMESKSFHYTVNGDSNVITEPIYEHNENTNEAYTSFTSDEYPENLQKAIDLLDEFSEAAWDKPCDEEKAKSALLNFYSVLKTIKADKRLMISSNRGGYYSFMINMIPFMKALDRKKYALACHELRTLCYYEPILQERIYCNLMILYREYIEEL